LSEAGNVTIATPMDVVAMAQAISTLANAALVVSKAAAELREASAKTINGDSCGQVLPPGGKQSSLGALAAYDD
jgi:hypothetical protein